MGGCNPSLPLFRRGRVAPSQQGVVAYSAALGACETRQQGKSFPPIGRSRGEVQQRSCGTADVLWHHQHHQVPLNDSGRGLCGERGAPDVVSCVQQLR